MTMSPQVSSRPWIGRCLAWSLSVLFWLDGLLTWTALSTVPGLREANPLGALFLHQGIWGIVALKSWASLYSLAVGYLVRPRRAVPVLLGTLVAYLGILIWNLGQIWPAG